MWNTKRAFPKKMKEEVMKRDKLDLYNIWV